MNDTPNIQPGQKWRRKADGTIVVIVKAGYSSEHGYSIAHWKQAGTKRKGDIDFGQFIDRYELVDA
ncbi:hypothetical protein ACFVAJ_17290 [Agromyces sp. NPDC057679]|uniref:hypothetical protein n=1 Tax=Agromyces sp. NPDC057679 TaxID=3346207 RepID=UPI00366DAB18